MRILRMFLVVCTLLALPAITQAQTVSKHYPDDDASCGGGPSKKNIPTPQTGARRINAQVHFGLPGGGTKDSISTADIGVTACEAGADVAKDLAEALCTACKGAYGALAVVGDIDTGAGPVDCGGPDPECSCDYAAGTDVNLTCFATGAAGGFKFTRTGDDKTLIHDRPGYELNSVNHNTNAGNTVGTDLFGRQLVAATGNGQLTVTKIPVSGQPSSCTTTFVNQGNDADHLGLANCYRSLGFVGVYNVSSCGHLSNNPARFPGSGVLVKDITGGGTVLQVDIKGAEGQTVEVETGTPPEGAAASSVPTLSAWGLMALAVFLMLGGAWLLRRRTALQQEG